MSIRINVGATFDAKDLQRAQRELDALAKKADTLSNRMNAVGGAFQSAGKQLSAVGSTMTRRDHAAYRRGRYCCGEDCYGL
jgi:ABC-type transporter Mla subunit MlaD